MAWWFYFDGRPTSLPLVGGTALVRTGDRLEPADKIGLGAITGQVMRTGGTSVHSGDELNQLLEQRAASVGKRVLVRLLVVLVF